MAETFAFQAEINQLLSLIINTFYTNKDVFLRELISNASDACDKLRFKRLTSGTSIADDELRIRISSDKETNTLTVEDTGIGMTKDDLISCLGTIAKSGTKAFMEAIQDGTTSMAMIGQFGVGFYSAYLVADNVRVITKHDDDEQYTWESAAGGSFTISPSTEPGLARGTRIVLHLKDDQTEYLEQHKLREIIKKHNEFVSHPIEVLIERQIPVETHSNTEEEDGEVQDDKKETKYETKREYECVNTQRPIWTRKPEEVTRDEYSNFYKSFTNDWEDHLAVRHFVAEGQVEFRALLYVPRRLPFDFFSPNYKQNNIKLYVRRVFIMDDSEELMPPYLSFIKGIVDSDDLPLNVSREILQQNNIVKVIKRNLVKKAIEMMSEVAQNKDEYKTFYEQFARQLKLGVHEDSKNREKLAHLLRFHTSKSGDDMISLEEYVGRMKEGQKSLFYITGESTKAVKSSPFIEKLNKNGFEVIFMTDAIDEYMMQVLREYSGKPFVCVTKDTELFEESDEDKKKKEERAIEFEPLCKVIKETLSDKNIVSVKVSDRVVDSPCVLVTDMYGWTANMERIMKAQALRDVSTSFMTASKKTMEINVDHVIIKELNRQVQTQGKVNKDIINLIYETALITSGFAMDDPSVFSGRIHRMIELGLGVGIGSDDGINTHGDESCSSPVESINEVVSASSMEDVD